MSFTFDFGSNLLLQVDNDTGFTILNPSAPAAYRIFVDGITPFLGALSFSGGSLDPATTVGADSFTQSTTSGAAVIPLPPAALALLAGLGALGLLRHRKTA